MAASGMTNDDYISCDKMRMRIFRCKRFAMLVEDGTVTKVNVEPDGTGLTCSLAENIV